MDEFSEKLRRGGGHFRSKKIRCRFLCIINDIFGHAFPEKSATTDSETRGGGHSALRGGQFRPIFFGLDSTFSGSLSKVRYIYIVFF